MAGGLDGHGPMNVQVATASLPFEGNRCQLRGTQAPGNTGLWGQLDMAEAHQPRATAAQPLCSSPLGSIPQRIHASDPTVMGLCTSAAMFDTPLVLCL